MAQIPGLKPGLVRGSYQVRIAGRDAAEPDIMQRFNEQLPPGGVVHIVPRVAGAEKNPVARIIAGVVLVVASIYTAGAGAAAFGAYASTVSGALGALGASLIAGGIAQLLAPKPPTPQTDGKGKGSTHFSGLDNLVAQGNPVPVLYGEMLTGSRVISEEISTMDLSGDRLYLRHRVFGNLWYTERARRPLDIEDAPPMGQPVTGEGTPDHDPWFDDNPWSPDML